MSERITSTNQQNNNEYPKIVGELFETEGDNMGRVKDEEFAHTVANNAHELRKLDADTTNSDGLGHLVDEAFSSRLRSEYENGEHSTLEVAAIGDSYDSLQADAKERRLMARNAEIIKQILDDTGTTRQTLDEAITAAVAFINFPNDKEKVFAADSYAGLVDLIEHHVNFSGAEHAKAVRSAYDEYNRACDEAGLDRISSLEDSDYVDRIVKQPSGNYESKNTETIPEEAVVSIQEPTQERVDSKNKDRRKFGSFAVKKFVARLK